MPFYSEEPFTITFDVEEINAGDNALGIDTYTRRVQHGDTVEDILHLIWYDSEGYKLKPIFVTLYDSEGNRLQHEKMLDHIFEDPPRDHLKMVIDYTLFGSSAIPVADPVPRDVNVEVWWEDFFGNILSACMTGNINTTVKEIQDFVAAERNLEVPEKEPVDGSYFNLSYDNMLITDNTTTLREVFHLDVPKRTVVFDLLYNFEPFQDDDSYYPTDLETADLTLWRFFIKIESDVPRLQNEASLFEVSTNTKLAEFKLAILLRMNYGQVRRTFVDQIKLAFEGEPIPEESEKLYDAMGLNNRVISSYREVLPVTLYITDHLSGVEGGIFSRQFLDDLRASDRFQFLPRPEPSETPAEGLETPAEFAEVGEAPIQPIEPVKVVMDGNEEWTLTGANYEMLETTSGVFKKQLLVDQTDLSSTIYEFKLGNTTVPLNTSQCIIVDSRPHRLYILLNSTGMTKLNSSFRNPDGSSLIQQVRVNMITDAPEVPPPPPQEDIPPVFNALRWVLRTRFAEIATSVWNSLHRQRGQLFNILRGAFILYMFGFHQTLLSIWPYLLAGGALYFAIYILFFGAARVSERIRTRYLTANYIDVFGRPYEIALTKATQLLNTLGEYQNRGFSFFSVTLVNYSVHRTRDFELLRAKFSHEDSGLFYIKESLTNLSKDFIMYILTLRQALQRAITEELRAYRENENNDLKNAIVSLNEKFQKARKLHEQTGTEYDDFDIDLILHIEEVDSRPAAPEVETAGQAGDQVPTDQAEGEAGQEPAGAEEGEAGQEPAEAAAREAEQTEMQYQIMLDQYLRLQAMHTECTRTLPANLASTL